MRLGKGRSDAWDGQNAEVNLLLNHASRWLDVESSVPYEGKVVIREQDSSADSGPTVLLDRPESPSL